MRLTYLSFLISIHLFSQNLVQNPSFELSEHCTDTISNFNKNVQSWSTPNYGTTDLFNSCTKKAQVDIPENYIGVQKSEFGRNYAGFYLYSDDDYREYIQGTFIEPLEAGKKYRISFYISLGETSKFAMKSIGFVLSNPKIISPTWGVLSDNELKNLWMENSSKHRIISEDFYSDRDNWTLVSKEFVAKGGEFNLVIGNFDKNSKSQKKLVNKKASHRTSYYFIDMVSVEPLFQTNQSKITMEPEKTMEKVDYDIERIVLDKRFVIKNVNFKLNSIELNIQTEKELNNIVRFLNENQSTQITISGHTDNIGTDSFNLLLSERRAESVATYLSEKGIDKERIDTVGYGNTIPLNQNSTEAERKVNRRVEFIIIENNSGNPKKP